jgi:hypothetical protein
MEQDRALARKASQEAPKGIPHNSQATAIGPLNGCIIIDRSSVLALQHALAHQRLWMSASWILGGAHPGGALSERADCWRVAQPGSQGAPKNQLKLASNLYSL